MTTVHPLQLSDEKLPETTHDFRVDIVVTPDDVVRTYARRRSAGVIWEHLDDIIEAIPVLAGRRPAIASKLKPLTGPRSARGLGAASAGVLRRDRFRAWKRSVLL